MKPDPQFIHQAKNFWANVRTISEHLGYTEKGTRQIKVPTLPSIRSALSDLQLSASHLVEANGEITPFGTLLLSYFEYRARVLNTVVEPLLMDAKEAKKCFTAQYKKLKPRCKIPMNKQKGRKRSPAFLTGLVNMIIESTARGYPCDFDPRELTTVTKNGAPMRTLARRVDGAFPSTVNPIAIWEIKEYYYTTTFGSRVTDGVYETLLDGMELEELRDHEHIDIKHYLIVDSHYTWWECGRSYLCRIIDMLHMGYVDEVLFGIEVLKELPRIAREWIAIAELRAHK